MASLHSQRKSDSESRRRIGRCCQLLLVHVVSIQHNTRWPAAAEQVESGHHCNRSYLPERGGTKFCIMHVFESPTEDIFTFCFRLKFLHQM